MKFDFDKVIDRRGTGSLKWDVPENELPMWVADMDFQTAPCIREALSARVEHGIFGYSIIPDEWADAYVNWWGNRHGFAIDRDWLVFCPPSHINGGEKAHHTRRECCSADPCLQYFL